MTSFGRYELVSRLANGGMGEVWLAHLRGASGFEKRVVIKIMLPHVAENPKLVEMFVAEASVAAQLSHPNIIQIYELGVVSGRYFIAMEYVAGRSLRQVGHQLRKLGRRMPIWFLLAVVGKTCQGLHYAHELCDANGRPMGLAHRDVSPENIMVSFTGDVKLIDFGALRVSTGNTHPASRKEDLVGKFSYMAPEQVRGVPASRRTDLYSVGEVLYEYLTGVRPYEAPDEAALLHKVARGDLIDPERLAPHLPRDLLNILRQVLAYDPKQRWSDAADLAEALLTLLKQANLPADQSAIGMFLATTFPDAPDVPKVVHQELARRTLPERDLAVAQRPLTPLRIPRKRTGDSQDAQDSVQIELEDFADSPTESSQGPVEPQAAAPSARPAATGTQAATSPERPEASRRVRPGNSPAVLAAALPPLVPRAPATAVKPLGEPARPAAPRAAAAAEPGSWPMASPVGREPAPHADPPLPRAPEGTEDRAETPRLPDSSWPVFSRGAPLRPSEQATARMFEGPAASRSIPSGADMFAGAAPRPQTQPVPLPGTRDVASLFATRRNTAAAEPETMFTPTPTSSTSPDAPEGELEALLPGTRKRAPTSEAERHFDRGVALLAERAFEQALEEWEKAHQLAPDNGKVRSNLRRLRKKLGRE